MADTLLRPRYHFKLATFKVWTPMHEGHQGYLARALEILTIDVRYIQETRI